MNTQAKKLCQFFTPLWVAEALVERHFPNLDGNDLVIEPSCGEGSFLKAVPAHVPAIGVEIDPRVAAVAREETGREILCGDFLTIPLDVQPTAIIGNPPFIMNTIDGFLGRAHQLLPEGGRTGLLLPAYGMQTAQRVAGYNERWSITAEMIPRNVFPRLREPLVFAVFSKDRRRILVGLALYNEAADVKGLAKPYKEALSCSRGSMWKTVCRVALERLGGEADLPAIYAEVEGNRPSRTQFWREKIRQTLREYADCFRVVETGRYALASAV